MLKHSENEIKKLKSNHIEMWNLVQSQVVKAFEVLKTGDRELAHEIVAREKSVNAKEILCDHHCENFIALFAPVAVDLRFVISLFKINNNLERIGDFAESIAKCILYKQSKPISKELYSKLNLQKMSDIAVDMLGKVHQALVDEDSVLCGKVLAMDEEIDKINDASIAVLSDYMKSHPNEAEDMLTLHTIIRRIERIGDRASNIAEDIVFFVDAKELRHQKK